MTAVDFPTLAVTGRGSVRVQPDRIVFTLDLDALRPSIDDAQRTIESLRERLATALARADVGPERVRSTGPRLQPRHEYENACWVYKGVASSETIMVRIPFGPGRATEVLRALADELEHVRVKVGYVARNTATARANALRSAVKDARIQAEVIAAAAGVELGPIRELNHSPDDMGGGAVVFTAAEPAVPNSGAEFEAAEIAIDADVKVVWSLVVAAAPAHG